MRIGVLKEKNPNEQRVAVTPEVALEYIKLGITVTIEKGAGSSAGFSDEEYKDVGAKIAPDAEKVISSSEIILTVQPLSSVKVSRMSEGMVLVGLLAQDSALFSRYAANKVSAFAMEFLPRITRAQTMDVLSSQSNLAGYKAVIDAVAEFGKVVPMMMTAAGTIKPANVLVLGAGVAGLQAIATAKRLGAIVSAFDVRPAVKEQVQSLGAKFVEVEANSMEQAETSGGYAKEMSEAYKKKQSRLIHDTIKLQDIVISTALIPGKPAPELITDAMLKDMRPGSVIVDLAVASGGNCKASVVDKITEKYGVKIIGYSNMPGRVAYDASRLYAKNLLNFVKPMINTKMAKIKIDFEDEIIQKTLIAHGGKIVHPEFKEGDK